MQFYNPAGQATTPAPAPLAPAPLTHAQRMGLAAYLPSRGVNVYPHDIFVYAGTLVLGIAAGGMAGKGLIKLIRNK